MVSYRTLVLMLLFIAVILLVLVGSCGSDRRSYSLGIKSGSIRGEIAAELLTGEPVQQSKAPVIAQIMEIVGQAAGVS